MGLDVTIKISIHAPAKGATIKFIVGFIKLLTISIHAPAKGATRLQSRRGIL